MTAHDCGGLSRALLLAILVATRLVFYPAAEAAAAPGVEPAQAVPQEGGPPSAAPPGDAPTSDASLALSAYKATTFKIGAAAASLSINLAGVGLVGGTLLTAFNAGQSWLVYVANDYLWDLYQPRQASSGQAFDAAESAWRTTEKFLTYKPVVLAIKLASIYALTGSASTMLVLGTLTTLSTTAVFYANNLAWDFYESSQRPLLPAPVISSTVGTTTASP